MATRGEIRDAITSEMNTVADTYDVLDKNGEVVSTVTLDSSDIGLRNPEDTEQFPQIVYHEDYRRVVYNGVGTGPDIVKYNPDGSVDKEVWREYIEAQFIIDVRASDEGEKEPVYEELRSQFAKYQFSPWDKTSLQSDIIDIQVLDAQTVDSGDVEDVIRGDQLEVRVTFHRDYAFTTDNIDQINIDVDVDYDREENKKGTIGSIDYSYVILGIERITVYDDGIDIAESGRPDASIYEDGTEFNVSGRPIDGVYDDGKIIG